jgi:4-amino-4-deoxy-L-arabinose transferase-like glycosyltransferase
MSTDQSQEVRCRGMSEAQKRNWLLPQVLLVLIAWLFLCWLHWGNDGLWYGDAPRHAANGLFWKDYLLNLSFDPRSYALSYYARYPVINPTFYPPAFYFLEVVLFGLFGPSPYVAKGLVLGFALMAALYVTAWCRRWIAENTAWAGALLVLLPGVVQWSHAIMLNVPALALSIGALYHLRRWLESPLFSPVWRHLYIGAALAVLSILTYLTSCVLFLIAGIWLLVERRWRLLWNRRTLAVFVVSALALLPWAIVVMKFESNRIQMATGTVNQFTNMLLGRWAYYLECWTYYLEQLPKLFSAHLLLIAAFGIAGGIIIRRWRHETIFLLIMTLVCLAFFSYVPSREGRYILLLSVPTVIFCLLGLQIVVQCLSKLARMAPERTRVLNLVALAALFISQAWFASKVSVPSLSGYKQLVAFLETVAPDEPIFYDGKHYAAFTFYVQARDPDYRRRVVLGRKLLYAESPNGNTQEFVLSPQDVVEVLRKRGGCRWMAVADHPDAPQITAPWHLRKAIKGPQFELVKSLPIIRMQKTGVERTSVCVYRFLVPIERADEIDMPFFSLGENVRCRIKPIKR